MCLYNVDVLFTIIQNNILRMEHFIINVYRDYRINILILRTKHSH